MEAHAAKRPIDKTIAELRRPLTPADRPIALAKYVAMSEYESVRRELADVLERFQKGKR